MMHGDPGLGDNPQGERKEEPSADKMADDAMDDILMEVRRLIADIDNPFTLLGKLVAVLGRDKVIDELGGGGDDDEKPVSGAPAQVMTLPSTEASLLDALALQQIQRGLREEAERPPPAERRAPRPQPQTEPEPQRQPEARQEPPQQRQKSGASPGGAPPSEPPVPKGAPASEPRAPASPLMASPSPRPLSEPGFPLVLLDQSLTAPKAGGDQSAGQPTMEFMKRVNSLELANFLTGIFGKERTIEILGSYVSRNWISDEVAKMVVDCVTLIEKGEFDVARRKGGELLAEDHQVALFLLDEFTKSLFNISLSLRFREMMAAMKAAFEIRFPDGTMDDVVDEEKMQ